jgi:peptidoglycan/LPS O-acetylase OafA/YrhL
VIQGGARVLAATVMATTEGSTTRIAALDFTKGALVLLMVVYHWLNYFVAAEGDFYRYLRFVTPSFILITGFLISSVYLSKYDLGDAKLGKRLAQRGAKVMGIFFVLNLIIDLLLHRSSSAETMSGPFSTQALLAVYVSGNTEMANGKVAAFYILVPISYLLLLAAGLVLIFRDRYVFLYAFVVFLAAVIALEWSGAKSANLELLTIGLLGVGLGYIPMGKINRLIAHPYVLLAGYVCYLLAITRWNVIYPLQIVGVCLNVILIYLLGTAAGDAGAAAKIVILLGKYSLVGYIAQMAILQILHRGLRSVDLGPAARGGCFVAATVLTIASVEVLHRARAKSAAVDGLYRAVFA